MNGNVEEIPLGDNLIKNPNFEDARYASHLADPYNRLRPASHRKYTGIPYSLLQQP